MTNLMMEILVKYVEGGIIAYALTFVALTARLTYLCVKKTGWAFGTRSVEEFNQVTGKREKASIGVRIIRYVVWPYGVITAVMRYFEDEDKWLRKGD